MTEIKGGYGIWAMPPARATHAPHRTNLRCFGLLVGIAIALAGCTPSPQQAANNARFNAEQLAQTDAADRRNAYTRCLYDATGPFGSASIDVVNDCRQRTRYQG